MEILWVFLKFTYLILIDICNPHSLELYMKCSVPLLVTCLIFPNNDRIHGKGELGTTGFMGKVNWAHVVCFSICSSCLKKFPLFLSDIIQRWNVLTFL